MRHIPEEELHAYLDQALSRSQCVEIERHLARCSRCQHERDRIAALRDRTTELLARLGPPPIVPPAFETLAARHADRLRRRRRWIAQGAWAASIIGAVAAGWTSNHHLREVPDRHPTVASIRTEPIASIQTPAPARVTALRAVPTRPRPGIAAEPAPQVPERQLTRATSQPEAGTPVQFALAVETDPDTFAPRPAAGGSATSSTSTEVPELIAQRVAADPGLQGLWRTILADSTGSAMPPRDVPLVPGLPVVQMRVQPSEGSSDVTAVDQVLESGELIRTIAGPAGRVGSLVADDSTASPHPDPTDSSDTRMTITIRQGDRMVAVTGPSQALGSLLSRVSLKKRRY